MSDRLIAEPTNESNPDIIKRLTLSKARSLIFDAESISRYSDPFTSLPRKFKDARAIKELDSEITKESSTHSDKSLTLEGFACAFLVFGMFVALIEMILANAGMREYDSLSSFLAMPASCLAIAAALGLLNLIRVAREPRPKANMIHARDFDMRDACADGAYKLMDVHEGVIRLSKRMLDCDHSYLRGINFSNLSDAYDSYTDMLAFVLANKDQLSDDLRKDYARALLKRVHKLKQELEDVDGIISEKAEYVNEMLRESQQTEQDFIDDRARAIMPIDED